jgi:tripartite ATP-independent transporter DctM subunit
MKQDLWQVSLPKVAVIGVIVSVLLFLAGMPIAYALIITSFVFVAHIRGTDSALFLMGAHPYRTTGSYFWSVIPFFVLMGFLNLYAKIGEDLYYSAYKWFGHLRGGLAIATVGACTAFSAIVGDGVAATATMGSVALPEMKKYNYDRCLSSGCIISGGALGPIIPPSAAFVTYGVLTGESIGDLFIAGIFPGLLIAAFFVVNIYIWCRRDPMAGPAGERSGWVERIKSLKSVGPTMLLFLIVIGGIYTGVFTPTEGGAIGAVGAFILGLVMGRFTWKIFAQCLLEAGKMTSMTFFILIGSTMFTRFAAWCNLSGSMSELFAKFALSPQIYAFLILVMLFILGFFIDGMPLILVGVPIVYPVAADLGLDQLWFATMFVLTVILGTRTPPVGINLFVFKGIAQDFPMGDIYKGAMPFIYGSVIAMIIIFFFPSIASWLPHALK